MTALDLKKLKVELARVAASRMEQELRIDEFKENIERLEAHILIQVAREEELQKQIDEAKLG